jgi:hypothetical protein
MALRSTVSRLKPPAANEARAAGGNAELISTKCAPRRHDQGHEKDSAAVDRRGLGFTRMERRIAV